MCGQKYWDRARQRLVTGKLDRRTLIEAGSQFWSALFYSEQWPTGLRQLATDVEIVLLASGPIVETVETMTDEELREGFRRLQRFLDAAAQWEQSRDSGPEGAE